MTQSTPLCAAQADLFSVFMIFSQNTSFKGPIFSFRFWIFILFNFFCLRLHWSSFTWLIIKNSTALEKTAHLALDITKDWLPEQYKQIKQKN